MSQSFEVKNLPKIDKDELYKGNCPWCITVKVVDGSLTENESRPVDICPECGDKFYS